MIITEQGEGDQTAYIIKDPQSRKFFRLRQHEFLIASQFEGKLTIAQLATHFKEELHLNVNAEGLSDFVEKLGAKGLLETSGQETTQTGQPVLPPLANCSPHPSFSRENKRRSRLDRLLYWKIAYFDPDAFFNRLLPHFRFLFTSAFFLLVVATILAAACVTAYNWDEITDQIQTLYSTASVLWALIIMMPILILHEMAHGMTCKYFGGEVHEMGFLLLYFQPACFCNVSDSYVFKKRSQRLWVMAAGVFIQTFLWAVLTLLWRILAPESLIARFIFINVAVTGFVTILQFNPLIKLDGYYILSELFSIPNLRAKSFAWLRAKARSFMTGTSGAIKGLSRRDRMIYWLYGMIAFIYSFGLIKYVILRVEQFFVEQYQGTGFILFWGVALFVVSDPLIQAIGHVHSKKMTEKKQSASKHKNLFVTGFFLPVRVSRAYPGPMGAQGGQRVYPDPL